MLVSSDKISGNNVVAALFVCDECQFPSMGFAGVPRGEVAAANLNEATTQWFPVRAEGKLFADVPMQIAEAADEAHRSMSIGARRGAVILARAVLEATCKDKGAGGKDLYTRIDALHSAGLINELVKDEAHEVRLMGNDLAHGDFGSSVNEAEAEEILALMGEVLEEVYQRPARLAARRATRRAETT